MPNLPARRGPATRQSWLRDAVAKGCLRVVAVGGDGTVNEVAQALIHTPAAMGLVPCGSGNGLALHLGLPNMAGRPLSWLPGTRGPHGRTGHWDRERHPLCQRHGPGARFRRGPTVSTGSRCRGLPAYARDGAVGLREAKDRGGWHRDLGKPGVRRSRHASHRDRQLGPIRQQRKDSTQGRVWTTGRWTWLS